MKPRRRPVFLAHLEKRRQLRSQLRLVPKGIWSAEGSRKKPKGLNTAMSATRSTSTDSSSRLLGKHDARQIVTERILLPVDEVFLGRHGQRVADDRRPAVRRGPQPDDVRRQRNGAIVAIACAMGQRDVNGHDSLSGHSRSSQKRCAPRALYCDAVGAPRRISARRRGRHRPGKELLIDPLPHEIHPCLQSIEILVQAGRDDVVHLRVREFRTQLAEQLLSGIAEHADRRSRDRMNRFARGQQTKENRARELAVEQQEIHDVCRARSRP